MSVLLPEGRGISCVRGPFPPGENVKAQEMDLMSWARMFHKETSQKMPQETFSQNHLGIGTSRDSWWGQECLSGLHARSLLSWGGEQEVGGDCQGNMTRWGVGSQMDAYHLPHQQLNLMKAHFTSLLFGEIFLS